jgi:hypothetical protein
MRMKTSFFQGIAAMFFTVAVAFAVSASAVADDMSDSSECVACHTDLEEMDDYGAEAASAAAAVAG